MSHIPFVFNLNTITFYVNHQAYMIDDSFPGFEAVKAELKNADPDVDRLIALTRPAQAVRDQVAAAVAADRLPAGVVSVTNSEIRYNGTPVHGVLIDRILDALAEGFDIMPQIRFMENLFMNPADFAIDELYLWLETSNLPITEDGHFLAYKNVNGNFTSIHDGKTDNTPGTVVSMPRQDVDQNRDHTCSRGLHFCSKSYLPNFSTGYDNKTLVLKINPADVVSIPSDYGNAKGRAWQYLVLDVVDEDPQSKQWASVVSSDGSTFEVNHTDEDDIDDDTDALLVIGSDMAKKLFALCNEIGLTEREDRLDWAFETLDPNIGDFSDSFNELTVEQAVYLITVAEAKAAQLEAAADETIADAEDLVAEARQAQADVINGLGIIALRKRASQAGHPGAWKGPRGAELKTFLIGQIK